MAFFEGWPYTNFHDCNLDWVMETTRKVHVEVHQLHQELHRAINCEEQQRIDADVKLGERIDKEITDRTEADNALGARIDKEIQDRVDAVQAEEEARIAADNALGARIDKEITDRRDAIQHTNERINKEIQDRTEAVQAEAEARTEADNALGARIDKEISDRQQADNALQDAINAEESARQDAINAEATARQAADAKLQQGIDAEAAARAQAVTAEAEARAAADTALGQRIDAEAADRTQAINAEATARQQADAALGARIDKEITDRTAKDSELETAIANEATTRANAVTDLRDDLTHEISDRKAGDDALGRRIDGIAPQLLPAGGTQGQVLGKATGDNYAVAWQDPAAAVNGLPEGGTVGQVLAKKGPDNFDAEWIDAPEGGGGTGEDPNAIRKDGTTTTTAAIPFAQGIQTPSITGTGMEGVALEANLDLNNHAITSLLPGTDEFDAVTVGQLNDKFANVHSIPVGGTAGQVLAKSTDADYQTEWVNQTGGLPEGGTTGQVVTKTADGAEWADVLGDSFKLVQSNDHFDVYASESGFAILVGKKLMNPDGPASVVGTPDIDYSWGQSFRYTDLRNPDLTINEKYRIHTPYPTTRAYLSGGYTFFNSSYLTKTPVPILASDCSTNYQGYFLHSYHIYSPKNFEMLAITELFEKIVNEPMYMMYRYK